MTTAAAAPSIFGKYSTRREKPSILSQTQTARLNRILGLWDVLVDPRVGVIQQISDFPLAHDDPDFFHYFSKACDTARFTPYSNFGNNGGASVYRPVAIAKAIGEGVERYCAAIYLREELLLTPYKSLKQRATAPELFTVYRPEQFAQEDFPWQPFTSDSPVHWTESRSLLTGETVLLPAASVFIPFRYRAAEISAHILQPISTGLACGCSFAEAAISGLCEVIERDAFSITWQAMLSRPRIRHETLPASGKDLVSRFARVGLDVHLMNITNDFGVPAIMSIALGQAATSPALALAAAADPNPERALTKSLEELAHTRKYARQVMQYLPPIPVQVAEGHPLVREQMEHLRFYCDQESKAYAEFAWVAEEECDLADLPDLSCDDKEKELRLLAERIQAVGLELLVCDLTSPDIRPLGLHVVRSVIPGAHPMCMGYRTRALASKRLYEVPQRLGHRGLEPGVDNPYPHPFP